MSSVPSVGPHFLDSARSLTVAARIRAATVRERFRAAQRNPTTSATVRAAGNFSFSTILAQ